MTTWSSVELAVTEAIDALEDGGQLVVGAAEPEREVVIRKRALWGIVAERRALLRPYTQFIRIANDVRGECIGGTQLGGPFPTTDDEHASLLSMGWQPADDGSVPNYTSGWLPHSATTAAHLADLTIRTLRDALSCQSGSLVTVERLS